MSDARLSPLPADWIDRFVDTARVWSHIRDEPPEHWIESYEATRSRFEDVQTSGGWLVGPASTLGILGRRHLELDHNRMLAWLLDPAGRHGLGDSVAQGLLRGLEGGSRSPITSVTVEEPRSDPFGQSGRADIVVRGKDWTVVIESKVRADQHGTQLDVYFDAYADEGAEFIFLTPGRRLPRSSRSDVRASWKSLSWRQDVIPALQKALAKSEASTAPGVHAARDYMEALREEFFA